MAEKVPEQLLAAVDLFRTTWSKPFIALNHTHDLETVEILLALGQRLALEVPAGRERDVRLNLVLAGVLRAALVASKGAYECIRRGLWEPGQALSRTLLDLDLALEYILANPVEKTERADRYLTWAYWKRLRALERQLSEIEVRTKLPADQVRYIEGRIRVCQENLDALPEASATTRKERNWHPFATTEGLARHLDRLDDYLQLYAPQSGMFVHSADPETHLSFEDNGSVKIKAFATTDPGQVSTALKLLAGQLERPLWRLCEESVMRDSPLRDLLLKAKMRLISSHEVEIPPDRLKVLEEGSGLRPEDWSNAISLPYVPGAELLEEAIQLVLGVLRAASSRLTLTQIEDRTGLMLTTREKERVSLLLPVVRYLVSDGRLRSDESEEGTRYSIVE